MTDFVSIARPYAEAAFDCALDKNDLSAWSLLLKQAARVIKEKSMQKLLKNPCIDKKMAYECLLELCKPVIFPFGKNFLKLMAVNQRLLVLPTVEDLFKQYKAREAKEVSAYAFSTLPLTKLEEQTLEKKLSARLQRHIKLTHRIDKSLLGGLIVRVGDLVIDGSVRGKLERLHAILVN